MKKEYSNDKNNFIKGVYPPSIEDLGKIEKRLKYSSHKDGFFNEKSLRW